MIESSMLNDTLNGTNETYCRMDTGPTTILICQEILYAIVCFVGLVGNTLVIYVVVRFSKMQTVTNMYIVNLAIADECFLIGIPFLIVTMMKSSWIFGDLTCKAYLILTSINQFTSSLFLFIMSADRYIAVCHPISSPRWRTPSISKVVSFLAWTFSILLMIPILIHSKQVEFTCIHPVTNKEETTTSCIINWTPKMTPFASAFIVYAFVFSFGIPLSLILVFYCLVIKKLKTVGPQNKSKEKKRSHRKVTKLVLTVVTVYIICWTPYWITQIALTFSDNGEVQANHFVVTIHLLAACLSYSNSAMNPILYAFLSDNFKKSFLKACTCAAGKDINATLHLENSVFPRKNRQCSAKFRQTRGTSICPNNEDECDLGPLVSRGDPSTSAITMTSRSINVTNNDNKEQKDTIVKNGLAITFSANL